MCMVGTGVDGSSCAEGCEELMKKMIEEHDVGHERWCGETCEESLE